MRYSIILLGLILSPLSAIAQGGAGAATGSVVADATSEPLASVSVAVRAAADSSVVAGELTNQSGRFRVANLAAGTYFVQITSLGYTPLTSDEFTITAANPTADLGTLRLMVDAIALEGVSVEAEQSRVIVAPDRNIYSTAEMPVAAGGVATDILRSVPELEVDIEGSVSLRGTTPQIYLNGRPAPMEGEALNVYLQQFPADRIDRIEVIANPSARYNAEGGGGIVNIVLKKDVNLGLSGSVFLNGGTRGGTGGGGRLAYQEGRLTLFGGSFMRFSERNSSSTDFRTNLIADPVTHLEQHETSEQSGWSGSLDLTGEFDLTEESMIWSEVQLYRNGDDSDRLTTYLLSDVGEIPIDRYDRRSTSESLRLSTEAAAGFRHKFAPRGHEISAQVEFETGGNNEEELIRQRILTLEGDPTELPVEITTEDADENERETKFELDYVRPWGEGGQIEIGYEGNMQDTDDGRLLRIFEDIDADNPLSVRDNGYGYNEIFNSAYITLARKMGSFGAQLGVRAERANTELTIAETGEVFDKDYSSFFPSANLSYEFGGGKQMRIAYSRRIRRPSPWVMNPINQSTDPLNIRIGNPDIDPMYIDSYTLGASWTGSLGTLRLSPYYRSTEGDWAQIKKVDEEGVSTVTWENLASVKSYGTSLTASVREVGPLSGYVSVSGSREVRDASNLAFDYSGDAIRLSARGNLTARITRNTSFQGMVFYMPGRDVPQGHMSSRVMMHFGMRQQLWGDRASVNLSVLDPFDMFDSSFKTSDPTHVQIGTSRRSMRSARISFSYSFGKPPEGARQEGMEPETVAPDQVIR
ncbi:MAG TPA: TonB-dependent receptor [Longimicrobiaceae bacterium]|nr:TonB-dependent receptor [Longimicrobiaceae bacterium]